MSWFKAPWYSAFASSLLMFRHRLLSSQAALGAANRCSSQIMFWGTCISLGLASSFQTTFARFSRTVLRQGTILARRSQFTGACRMTAFEAQSAVVGFRSFYKRAPLPLTAVTGGTIFVTFLADASIIIRCLHNR